MTRFLELSVAVFAAAELVASGAAAGHTNESHRQQLLQSVSPNESFARSPRAAREGYVPTNTVAFRQWALDAMLAQANLANERWQLGLPKPLTSDHVTRASALPKIEGPEGAISISDRFTFGFNNGRWTSFQDSAFCWGNLETDFPRLGRLTKQPSSLTKSAASTVARETLSAIGIDERKLKVVLPPEVLQYEYEDRNGKRLPVPLFKVQWKAGKESGPLSMEISGVTKNVVAYENFNAAPMPLPPNYFALLGVSARPEEWGTQFGYDPANTHAFQAAARLLAVEQVNHLNQIWSLGSSELSTNDLEVFLAKPVTNTFDITMAQFSNRFYLQIQHGRIQLFKDLANNIEGLAANETRLKELAIQTNFIDSTSAVRIARDALHRLGFNEKELQLREPPTVKQVRVPSESGRPFRVPMYDVLWLFPESEQWKYGEGAAAVAFQVSGFTTGVVMYANNWLLTPQIKLSTNNVMRRNTVILQPK